MKRLLLVLGVTLLVGLSGAVVASVLASSPSPKAPTGEESQPQEAGAAEASAAPQDAGVHGGTISRFQGDACVLTSTSALHGNWTHGDYVSAVAADGSAVQIQEAAHSGCGKPTVAAKSGPPAHALANKAAGLAHKPDGPDDETTAPSSAS